MIAAGSRVRRFENTAASARDLVEEVLQGGIRFIPKIQKEVVEGKKLSDTKAGAFLDEAMKKIQEQHKLEMETIKNEAMLAQRACKWISELAQKQYVTDINASEQQIARSIED